MPLGDGIPLESRLQAIHQIRVRKRSLAIIALAKELKIPERTVRRWVRRYILGDMRFDSHGRILRKPRSDRGQGRKYSYDKKMVNLIKAKLRDPDRMQKDIALELAVPKWFVSAVAAGKYGHQE